MKKVIQVVSVLLLTVGTSSAVFADCNYPRDNNGQNIAETIPEDKNSNQCSYLFQDFKGVKHAYLPSWKNFQGEIYRLGLIKNEIVEKETPYNTFIAAKRMKKVNGEYKPIAVYYYIPK